MGQIADLIYIDSTGPHIPDFPTIQNAIVTQVQGIYGADTYLDPDSQDGQFLAVFANAIYDSAMNGLSVYNSYSPATAQGAGLASNVKINGIRKQVATNSTAELTLIGTVGTVITDGIATDTLGQDWVLPDSVTIGSGGTVTVTATAAIAGAIQAAPSTITNIKTQTRGWLTVSNSAAATVGVGVEEDSTLRQRQTVSTALAAQTVLDGIVGSVANVAGVTDYKGYENPTNSSDANGIPAFNISVVVEGGDDADVANAIALRKPPGVPTYGTTNILYYDAYGSPSYINFYRPTVVPITVTVNIHALTGYSSVYTAQIQQAIADYINNSLSIGDDVLYTKLYAPANLPGMPASDTFDITSILICRSGSPAAANVTIAFNEVSSCDVADITVNVS